MPIDFKPQNALEQAIFECDSRKIIYSVAEGKDFLTALAPASHLGYDCFSDEVVFSVLLLAATKQQLKMMNNGWFYGYLKAGERMRKLAAEAVEILPQEFSESEKRLADAVTARENNEIIRLIEEEKIVLHSNPQELLTELPKLSKSAALSLLRNGLSAKLKAVVFGIFLKESQAPEVLKTLSYDERIMFTNLMIKILTASEISADEPWYPETA